MLEITNNQKNGELQLGFKDKKGQTIAFTYGMVIDETMVDADILKNSLEKGLLFAYMSKGWVLRGRVNVNNKIIGSPVPFVGITLDEAGKAIEIKAKQRIVETGDARAATEIPNITSTENTDKSIGDVSNMPKKRGRPSNASMIASKPIEQVINEVKAQITSTNTTVQATPEGVMPQQIVKSIDDVPPAGDAIVSKPAPDAKTEPKKEDDFV